MRACSADALSRSDYCGSELLGFCSINRFLGCLPRAAREHELVAAENGEQGLFPEAKLPAPVPSPHPEHALDNTTKPKDKGLASSGSIVFLKFTD